jgi:hypothetical protein
LAARRGGYADPMAPDPDELERRSEELHEHIEAARRQAQRDHVIPDPDHHVPTLVDPDADGEEGNLGPATG